MTTLPDWAEEALQEHAPLDGATAAARERFDVLRARVERAGVIVATEVTPALRDVSDAGKRAVFAQAVWAGKYYGEPAAGTEAARAAIREATRLGEEIRSRLDELVVLAHQHSQLMADHALAGGWPALDELLEAMRKTHPRWALVSGLALERVIDISKQTSQDIPEFADVLEALAAAAPEPPRHWLGDALSSRKAIADRARVLLHALALLANHPHLPRGFRLSNAGVAGLARVVFDVEIDADAVRKVRGPITQDI